MTFDFRVYLHGSAYLVCPNTEDALAWCDQYFPRERSVWGGYVYEYRYLRALLNVLATYGFSIIHGNRIINQEAS